MYKEVIRPILFKVDPENIHDKTLQILQIAENNPTLLKALNRFFEYKNPSLETEVFEKRLKNPIGLAAGFDKNGENIKSLSALGFGFIEIGTVTLLPQEGNKTPRICRIPQALTIENSMGFPNDGAEKIASKILKAGSLNCAIGVSISLNKETPAESAAEEIAYMVSKFANSVDFITIDLSSPNTPGLRNLQSKNYLSLIAQKAIEAKNQSKSGTEKRNPKILVKISPDLSLDEISDILEIATQEGMDGIEATNTTTSAPGLERLLGGGVSGAPLRTKSNEIIRFIYQQTKGNLTIIGIGGVFTAQDAIDKIMAGANAVQLYTGLVYEGPCVVKNINNGIVKFLEQEGIQSISELRGITA